jgi:hypothetical protein
MLNNENKSLCQNNQIEKTTAEINKNISNNTTNLFGNKIFAEQNNNL